MHRPTGCFWISEAQDSSTCWFRGSEIVKKFCLAAASGPRAGELAFFEPHNPSIDVSELRIIWRSTDFDGLKIWSFGQAVEPARILLGLNPECQNLSRLIKRLFVEPCFQKITRPTETVKISLIHKIDIPQFLHIILLAFGWSGKVGTSGQADRTILQL